MVPTANRAKKKNKKKSRAIVKSRGKPAKKAARKAGKSSSKKGKAKPAAKKTKKVRKKAVAKKAVKKASKTTAKSASKKRATPSRGKKKSTAPGSKDAVLALDDLVQINELVADARPKAPAKKSKAQGPQTPTAPRSVKPPPKSANLEMSAEILAFVDAIDAYRQENSRPFPTWTEVFSILKKLGYTKS